MLNLSSDDEHMQLTDEGEGSNDGREYDVEEILAEKVDPEDGIRRYLVKWDGYSMEYCTWEPQENFQDQITLQKWREKKESTPKSSLFDYKVWDAEQVRLLQEHMSSSVTSSAASSNSEDDQVLDSDDSLQQELITQEQARRKKKREKKRRRDKRKKPQIALVESEPSTDLSTKTGQVSRTVLPLVRPPKPLKRQLNSASGLKQRESKSLKITPTLSKTPRRSSLDETLKDKVWGLSYQNRAAKIARRERTPHAEDLSLFKAGASLPLRLDSTKASQDVQANADPFDFTKLLDQVESGEQIKSEAARTKHANANKPDNTIVLKDDYTCQVRFGRTIDTANIGGHKLPFRTHLEAHGSGINIHHILGILYIEKYLVPRIGLPSDNAEVELVTSSSTSFMEVLNTTQAAAIVLHHSFTLLLFMTHVGKFKEIFKLSPSITSRPLRAVIYSGLNLKSWAMPVMPVMPVVPGVVASNAASRSLHISSLHEQALPYSHQLSNILGTGTSPVLSRTCELNVCFAFLSPPGTEKETYEIQDCLSYLLDREVQTRSDESAQIRTKSRDVFIDYDDIVNGSKIDYNECKEVLVIMIHNSLRCNLHTIPLLSKVRLSKNKAHMFFLFGTTFNTPLAEATNLNPLLVDRTTLQIYPFGGLIFVPEEVILHEGSKFQFIINHISRSAVKTWALAFKEHAIDDLLTQILERHGSGPSSEQASLFRLADDLKGLRNDQRIIELTTSHSNASPEVALDAFVQFQIEACSTYRRFIALESQTQCFNRTTRSLYTNVEFLTIQEFEASIQPSRLRRVVKA